MPTRTDVVEELAESIKGMGDAIGRMKTAMDACKEEGLSSGDIRDEILKQLPEEEREAFAQQWPMMSMMLSAL